MHECPNCAEPLAEGDVKCASCGEGLTHGGSPARSQARPVVLVVGAITVLLLISTCAFFAVAGLHVQSSSVKLKTRKAQIDMRALETAMQLYKIDNGDNPDLLDDLVEKPVGAPRWRGPYLGGPVPLDPWGNPYVYQRRMDGFTLTCYGSDGVPGGFEDQTDLSITVGN